MYHVLICREPWLLLFSIPPIYEPARIKQKGGRPIPEESQCHFRGTLAPGIPQPKMNSVDIWFIDDAGNNLASSIADVSNGLQQTGIQWFEQFANPDDVLRILLTQPEEMSRLWGFGNNPSPLRHYMIGYVALSRGDGRIAAEHLQAALESHSFATVYGRLASDTRAAVQQIVAPERG